MTRKIATAMAMIVGMGLFSADASMKQMEIKGKVALDGYTVSYNEGTTAIRGGGSDAVAQMDVDLDFKMKFSQDVSARLDLEMDNATPGGGYYTVTNGAASATANRFDLGIDQAYFRLNDFLFKNFAMTIGKQNLNFSLRDNKSYSWSYGDPMAVVGTYSTRDADVRLYWAKLAEDKLTTGNTQKTNDADQGLIGSYVEYWLNDDSLVIGYLNYKSDNAAMQNILHYGIGIDYFIGESLELYGEVAGQNIDQTNVDGSALQLNVGAEYAFSDFDMKPTLNLDYYMQSGDSNNGDPDTWQAIVGGQQSAENHSLFVEGSSVRDTNFNAGLVSMGGEGYSVIRLNGWISPTKATKVGLGLHMFTDEDESDSTNDDMGLEVDLTGTWKYSQDVTFIAGAFMWTAAEGDGATGYVDAAGNKADVEDVVGLMVGSALSF